MRRKRTGETRKKLIFKYSRPVEQMGIAITYGGLEDIYSLMDDDEMEKAVKKICLKVADNEWDLLHTPSKTGLGGKFSLVWIEK